MPTYFKSENHIFQLNDTVPRWFILKIQSGIIFFFIANSSIGVTGVKSGLRDDLYELGLAAGLMVAYISYKKPEANMLHLTET